MLCDVRRRPSMCSTVFSCPKVVCIKFGEKVSNTRYSAFFIFFLLDSIQYLLFGICTPLTETKEFLDVCLNFNLSQMITEQTRVNHDTASTLDIVLTSHPKSMSPISYLHKISDHKQIPAVFSFSLLYITRIRKSSACMTKEIKP